MSPTSSILRQLQLSFLGFGLGMGIVFPFYAYFFVDWKDGMLPWFVAGCVIAGLSIGVVNHKLLEWLLIRKLRQVAVAAERIRAGDLRRRRVGDQAFDLFGRHALAQFRDRRPWRVEGGNTGR